MDDCYGLPFITPEKPEESKSFKDIADEIKKGTSKDFKQLSALYNAFKKVKENNEKIS